MDSNASGDSFNSFRFAGTSTPTPPSRPGPNPAGHSSNSSVNNFQVPRKSSFASLRNPFKSTKVDADAPPVPPLNEPFSHSFSSQTSLPRDRSRQASISSLQHPKVPSRTGRTGFARQPSQSGSFFQSENGSNPTIATPPLPKRHADRNRPSMSTATQERGQTMPSDYALTVVFHRFVTSAEELIAVFLQRPLDDEPYLPDFLGPDRNKAFDGLLDSLGRIAQRHTSAVIDCITRWRRTQNEPVTLAAIRTNP